MVVHGADGKACYKGGNQIVGAVPASVQAHMHDFYVFGCRTCVSAQVCMYDDLMILGAVLASVQACMHDTLSPAHSLVCACVCRERIWCVCMHLHAYMNACICLNDFSFSLLNAHTMKASLHAPSK